MVSNAAVAPIPGLRPVEQLVLKLACEHAVEFGDRNPLAPEKILPKAEAARVAERDFYQALEGLARKKYIEGKWVPKRPGMAQFTITVLGFEQYATTYISNYASIRAEVFAEVIKPERKHGRAIAAALGQPQRIVDHVLRKLATELPERLFKIYEYPDGVGVIFLDPSYMEKPPEA